MADITFRKSAEHQLRFDSNDDEDMTAARLTLLVNERTTMLVISNLDQRHYYSRILTTRNQLTNDIIIARSVA
jgi:hypothetical protein